MVELVKMFLKDIKKDFIEDFFGRYPAETHGGIFRKISGGSLEDIMQNSIRVLEKS